MENRPLELIVFYADLVCLAETAEILSPKQLKRLSHTLLNEMTNVTRDFGGTVLKYVEDCVVGFFVLPAVGWTQQLDRALLCTEMMQKVMEHSVGPIVQSEGLPAIGFRIGVDCGGVQVLSVRAEGIYTEVDAFGDIVNVAKKICDKAESGEVLIGKNLWRLLHASRKMGCTKRKSLVSDGETYDLYSLEYQ
ncbi:MAG: adenylate/guanylate cyclase domain-containing protein [Candidatus Bathyarchaeota archaeon]|nr:MAG: adenylate/guanylate cyclase domain-containing protein [Candidatus Bathyarchaeota archaeon]